MLKSIEKAINIDQRFVLFANFSTQVKKLKRQTAFGGIENGQNSDWTISPFANNMPGGEYRGRNTFPDCFSILIEWALRI